MAISRVCLNLEGQRRRLQSRWPGYSPPLALEKQAEKSSRYKQQTYRLLAEAGIPDIIADILLEWRRRAMQSLQILEPSEARDALLYIFEYVMRLKPHDTGAMALYARDFM